MGQDLDIGGHFVAKCKIDGLHVFPQNGENNCFLCAQSSRKMSHSGHQVKTATSNDVLLTFDLRKRLHLEFQPKKVTSTVVPTTYLNCLITLPLSF